MVLESLTNPGNAEKHKSLMILLGFSFAIVGAILSYFMAGPVPSMMLVFFTAIPAIPVMYAIIKYEEEKDVMYDSEKKIFKEHTKALGAFMFLFLGMVIGLTLVFVVVPSEVDFLLFEHQLENLEYIQSSTNPSTGMVTASQSGQFGQVFFNNVRVLIISIIFSFLFGAGAIFVLAWNASVIAAAIGSFIKEGLAFAGELTGIYRVAFQFETITVGFLMYALHGIPEILGYFTAALAGGIISVAVIKHEFGTPTFLKVLVDSADLVLASLVLLFMAALLEVYITPLIF